jgi:hypothetical protein
MLFGGFNFFLNNNKSTKIHMNTASSDQTIFFPTYGMLLLEPSDSTGWMMLILLMVLSRYSKNMPNPKVNTNSILIIIIPMVRLTSLLLASSID